jgi:predicted HicB family RNase H-like nuclease
MSKRFDQLDYKTTITFRVEVPVKRAISKRALKEQTTVSRLVEQIILKAMKERQANG